MEPEPNAVQTVTDKTRPLSSGAQALLDTLRRQRITSVFDASDAIELIDRGFAKRSDGGLDLINSGLLDSQMY